MITDPHDPRTFRRYVSLNPDGTIAAVHDFEASVESPLPMAVEVTDLHPTDYSAIAIDPTVAGAVFSAVQSLAQKQQAVVAALAAVDQSVLALSHARGEARAALSTAVAKGLPPTS